jgi:hypothetical protein
MPFAIKTTGGPVEGVRVVDDLSRFGLSWPLPDELPRIPGSNGVYKKVSQSELDPSVDQHPNVGLGVEYEWVEDE